MKKMFLIITLVIFVQCTNAQLTNTSWSGKFKIPDETETVLQFKVDSLLLKYPDNTTIETMSYKVNNDTISILKLDGGSACSNSKSATYKFSIKDKKLYFSVLNDDCNDRISAWPDDGLKLID